MSATKIQEVQTEKKQARTLEGRVTSNKMDKTVTVLIERKVKHELYGKYMVRSKKYHAHDETNAYKGKVGVNVRIRECRPLSKTKNWEVLPVEGAKA
jgi:small subunit ribosomal protein S17